MNHNIDGAAMFHRTKYSVWSNLCQINELPNNLRFKMILTSGIWYTDKEPTHFETQNFLLVFLKQIKKLMFEGFPIVHRGKTRRVYVLPLFFCIDAIARAIVSSRISVLGYFGCNWCYIYGLHENGAVRFPLNDEGIKTADKRTLKEYITDLDTLICYQTDDYKKKKGIKNMFKSGNTKDTLSSSKKKSQIAYYNEKKVIVESKEKWLYLVMFRDLIQYIASHMSICMQLVWEARNK